MKGTKTSLFLVELMISLLMFSFCAAVCIQLFHAARVRTDKADELSRAVNIVTSAAEVYKTSDGTLNKLSAFYDKAAKRSDDGVLTVYYDNNWNAVQYDIRTYSGTLAYSLQARLTNNGLAEISVYDLRTKLESAEDVNIFSVTVKAVSVNG